MRLSRPNGLNLPPLSVASFLPLRTIYSFTPAFAGREVRLIALDAPFDLLALT